MTPQTEPNAAQNADNGQHVYVTPQNLRRFKREMGNELRPDMASHPDTRCRRVITGVWPKLAQPHNGNTYTAKCYADGILVFKLNARKVTGFMESNAETLELGYIVPDNGNPPIVYIGFHSQPFRSPVGEGDTGLWKYNLLNPDNIHGLAADVVSRRITLRKTKGFRPFGFGSALVAAMRFPHVKAGKRYYVAWLVDKLVATPTKPVDAVVDGLPAPDVDLLELSGDCISPVCNRYSIRVQYRTRIKKWDAAQGKLSIRRVWGCKKRIGNWEHPVRLKPICVFRACFTLARCNERLVWGADRMMSPWSVFTFSRGRLKRLG